MVNRPLPNYLRMYRKRTGLSQDEVAWLMGVIYGTTVSRHETSIRVASLEAALAYECVYGIAVADLFEGEVARIRLAVQRRARRLRASVKHRNTDRNREQKLRHLTQVLSVPVHGASHRENRA